MILIGDPDKHQPVLNNRHLWFYVSSTLSVLCEYVLADKFENQCLLFIFKTLGGIWMDDWD